MEKPLEDTIRDYIENKNYVGLQQVYDHLQKYGYRLNKELVRSVLNGLCDEGILVFLGWHEGQAVYQIME